ncbi:MAG: hypothetical protein WBX26_12535, partial [Candidatus Cybelea sp.]
GDGVAGGDIDGEGVAGNNGVGLGDSAGVTVALGADCERADGGAPAAKAAKTHAAAKTPSVKGFESPS